MKTLLTKPKMAAILAAAIGLALSGQASASVYARSHLKLDNFAINISPFAGSTVQSFTFDLTNTARLNGVAEVPQIASCGGTPALNNCNKVGNVLNALPVNALGTGPARVDNVFTYKGPGTFEYASSDSVIKTAQLVNGTLSSTEQIAEGELQSGTTAGSTSQIDSQTNFTFTFTIAAPGQMQISWDAVLDQLAQSDDPGAISDQADASFTFHLQQVTDTAGGSLDTWTWNSDGLVNPGDTGCQGTLGCNELADSVDLNGGAAVFGVGTDVGGGSGSFSTGTDALLDGGTYALTLTSQTSTSLQRIVPEPSVLLLLGAGLLGAGFKKRGKISKLLA